jgi:transposase
MLSRPRSPRQPSATATPAAAPTVADIGVGIDTSRYGHHAAFLDAQLQTAAADLQMSESAAGYAQLRQRLVDLVARYGRVHFHIRLDAAGLYADNLLAWLGTLAIDHATVSLSCGDTQRNKNYRVAVYGHQKSDPIEARACARYALTERPRPDAPVTAQMLPLRQVAGRLQAVVRQRTRLVNQLHQLLARTFPELAVLVADIATGWVLELLTRFPTAPLLALASDDDLKAIPYLPHDRIDTLLAAARHSIGALAGTVADDLVRDQVRQLRDAHARQKRLESLLVAAYRHLPNDNRLATISGFGDVTAAILTAFILDISRFATPGQLVNYFGVLPVEASSGIDRDGTPRGPKRFTMSPRGNDLVRRYLWMAALSAARHNPACRALYARVRAKHPDRPAIAIGHVMRKLLHLAFAVWKTGQPFDPEHYPWEQKPTDAEAGDSGVSMTPAAGLRNGPKPIRQEVTATGTATVADPPPAVDVPARAAAGVWLDFAHLKTQLPMARVLDHLGLTARLKGSGPQRRCACPIHRGDGRGRTFSVDLESNVYQCFAAGCASQGDVIDLWASVNRMSLRDAALDLASTFGLEPSPPTAGTEKRNG